MWLGKAEMSFELQMPNMISNFAKSEEQNYEI
jgi:hypothetical protein